MEQTIIFQKPLAIYPQPPVELGNLTAEALLWLERGEVRRVDLRDVVGVSTKSDRAKASIPCLLVHAYPIVKTGKLATEQRVLKEYCFTCPNLETRSQWQQAINRALASKQRQLQIIINPVSGKKQASEIFERVRPLLDRSYLQYTVRETHSTEDTQNFVRNLDLANIDGLVVVGGDGTVHDAIAGLMMRPDWEIAIKLPLGVIPGGTGNGLSKSLLELAKAAYDPLNAAFAIAKGKLQAFDLAAVEQGDRQYYSCLSLAWGLVSDADIESEKLKFLGSLRFDLYALWLIARLRTYRGRFSFVPHPDCPINSQYKIEQQGEWQVIEDNFVFLWAMNTPWAAHDMNVTPYARLDDGAIDVLIMRQGTSRLEILKALLRCGKGEHLDLPNLEYYKVSSFRLEPLTPKGLLVVDGELVDYSPLKMTVIPNLARVHS